MGCWSFNLIQPFTTRYTYHTMTIRKVKPPIPKVIVVAINARMLQSTVHQNVRIWNEK